MDTIGLAITTGAGALAVELMVAYLMRHRGTSWRPDHRPAWRTTNDGATWSVD